jgi:hypothetical protein
MEMNIWSHLTIAHIWAPFLITPVEYESVALDLFEMKDYESGGVSKNEGYRKQPPF